MGTAESSTGESSSNIYWRGALQAHDAWLKVGHSTHGDLRFDGGAGAGHNEAAWSRQLPASFAFLLDPWREANPLAQTLFPPQISLSRVDLTAGEAVIRYTGLIGTAQAIQEGNSLKTWLTTPLPAETELWEIREAVIPLSAPIPDRRFWRLRQDPWPSP